MYVPNSRASYCGPMAAPGPKVHSKHSSGEEVLPFLLAGIPTFYFWFSWGFPQMVCCSGEEHSLPTVASGEGKDTQAQTYLDGVPQPPQISSPCYTSLREKTGAGSCLTSSAAVLESLAQGFLIPFLRTCCSLFLNAELQLKF